MLKIITVLAELLVFLCALWFLFFLSILLHELGHAIGYMIATGDRHWHIRVGWGGKLLRTKVLTVNLLVFDGFFTPSGKKIDARAKLITTIAGGPVVSLLLVLGLSVLKFGGISFQSDILADGVIESCVNTAFFLNLFMLLSSVAPIHYFFGEIKGFESDGLQILHAVREHGSKS